MSNTATDDSVLNIVGNKTINAVAIGLILISLSYDTVKRTSVGIYHAIYPIVTDVTMKNIRSVPGGLLVDFTFDKKEKNYSPLFPFIILTKQGKRAYIYKKDFPESDRVRPTKRPTGFNESIDWPLKGIYSVCNIQSITIEHENEITLKRRESIFWTPENHNDCKAK